MSVWRFLVFVVIGFIFSSNCYVIKICKNTFQIFRLNYMINDTLKASDSICHTKWVKFKLVKLSACFKCGVWSF